MNHSQKPRARAKSASNPFSKAQTSSLPFLNDWNHLQWVCGVDEAGRGPLAGDVYAAAVILNPQRPIIGLNDSKKLSENKREALALEIRAHALAYGVAHASVAEIDQLNILQATLLAMQRAVQGLVEQFSLHPELVLVDGNRLPHLPYPSQAIVQGDALVPAISAASILAKTTRDATMKAAALHYPDYGFEIHKGYGTALHMARLKALGACPLHRKSFAPVKATLNSHA